MLEAVKLGEKSMRFISALLVLFSVNVLATQEFTREIPIESSVVTDHQTVINGENVKYSATAGTQPVWDNQGSPIATLFYTYYKRTDLDTDENRPLLISFNGGPGSASVWMHIAYTGPKVLRIDSEGYPIQPYGVETNPYSVLDVADILFVNPVNTAYSRVLKDSDGNMPSQDTLQTLFFGVNADISYLAEWLNTFVTRNNRWRSPKYLIGESYGTTRVSGLAHELQNRQWMYLNGVILVSPTEIGITRDGPVEIANRLPYYTATAWYHGQLSNDLQKKSLLNLLSEVEAYALDVYLPALARSGSLTEAKRNSVAQQVAHYSGLTVADVLNNNLNVETQYFWKALLRSQGKTVGRLDSRYLGIDQNVAGSRPDYWAELTSWLHSFTPAINYYLQEELDYNTDVKYNMFGSVHPWDRTNNNTGEQLKIAMAQNPYLNVLIQAGYYDGATNYFDAKYTMWQLNSSGEFGDRLFFEGYESGHMMYLRREDLKNANDHLRQFILSALPNDKAAKYELQN